VQRQDEERKKFDSESVTKSAQKVFTEHEEYNSNLAGSAFRVAQEREQQDHVFDSKGRSIMKSPLREGNH